jgi:hypothetical protein
MSAPSEVAPVLCTPCGLQESLNQEVADYTAEVMAAKRLGPRACKLCPFRTFTKKRQLIAHLEYHKEPFFTAASASSKSKTLAQYNVVQGLYNHRVMESVLPSRKQYKNDLLEQSASLLRSWNTGISEAELRLLGKSNQVPVVMVWTKEGPKYMTKQLAAAATRLSPELYYTTEFEELVVGAALQCRAQIGSIVDHLQARWSENPDVTPLLASVRKEGFRDCVHDIFTKPKAWSRTPLLSLRTKRQDAESGCL